MIRKSDRLLTTGVITHDQTCNMDAWVMLFVTLYLDWLFSPLLTQIVISSRRAVSIFYCYQPVLVLGLSYEPDL